LKGKHKVTIRSEHFIFTDEQIAGMTTLLVDDDDPDASTIVWNNETAGLIAIVRASASAAELRSLLKYFDMVRIDWLGVLGYEEDNVSLNQHPG